MTSLNEWDIRHGTLERRHVPIHTRTPAGRDHNPQGIIICDFFFFFLNYCVTSIVKKRKIYRSQFQQDPSKSLLYPSSSLFFCYSSLVECEGKDSLLFREIGKKKGLSATMHLSKKILASSCTCARPSSSLLATSIGFLE